MKNRILALNLYFITAFMTSQPAHAETAPRTVEITADRDDTGVTVAAANDIGIVFTLNLAFSDDDAKACDLTAVASDGTIAFDYASTDCRSELDTMIADAATATADPETPLLVHRMAMVLVLGKRDVRPATSGGLTAPPSPSSGSTSGGYTAAPSSATHSGTGMVATPQRTTTTSYEREASTSVTMAPKTVTKTQTASATKTTTFTASKSPIKAEPVRTEYKATAYTKGTAPAGAKIEAKTSFSSK